MIRRARFRDAAAIQEIYAADRDEEDVIGTSFTLADWASYVGIPHIILLVAEEAGRIEGFIMGYDLYDWGLMETIVVRRDARGGNLGGQLMDAFIAVGDDRWVAAEMVIDPDNSRLRRFADRVGFKQKDRALWCVRPLGGTPDAT